MTTYIEVAQALVSAGYLSEADIEAAADVLDDALIIADAEEWQDAAADDYTTQEDIISEAEVWEREDEVTGDYASMEEDEDVIGDAIDQAQIDKETMVEAQVEIDAAYMDAASALLAAALIDEANLQAAAAVIADTWVVEVD
jgi:hypothetical protein